MMARARAEPWAMTTVPPRPSSTAPPCASASNRSARRRSRPRLARRATAPAGPAVSAARVSVSARRRLPSIVLSATFPVKPSVTTTSTAPASASRPSTFPVNRTGAEQSSGWARRASRLPLPGSEPIVSRPTVGDPRPRTARA